MPFFQLVLGNPMLPKICHGQLAPSLVVRDRNVDQTLSNPPGSEAVYVYHRKTHKKDRNTLLSLKVPPIFLLKRPFFKENDRKMGGTFKERRVCLKACNR